MFGSTGNQALKDRAVRSFNEALELSKQAKMSEQLGQLVAAQQFYSKCRIKAQMSMKDLPQEQKELAQRLADAARRRLGELQGSIPVSNTATNAPQRAGSQYLPKMDNQLAQGNAMDMSSAIMTERPDLKFTDVAGLAAAKQALTEAVILPIRIPGFFTGPVKPWKGILLYGPPGTGKSYLARALAGESEKFVFLTVSTADLTSKWVGESEKLIKGLFETARRNKPAVVFIDEIDSLVSERGENDSEAGRRMKTEFLVQMDGVGANNDGVLIVAATNLPWALDPAMRRRFEKRIYIPLPDKEARISLIKSKIKGAYVDLTDRDIASIADKTNYFSGADIAILVRDALMQPIREFQQATCFVQGHGIDTKGVERDGLWMPCTSLFNIGGVKTTWDKLPPNDIAKPKSTQKHFLDSLKKIKPSVSPNDLRRYENWTREYGENGTQ